MSQKPTDKVVGYLYAIALEERAKEIAKLDGCIIILGPGSKHPERFLREKIKTRANEMWPNINCFFPEDFPIQQEKFSTYRELGYFLVKTKYVKLVIVLLVPDATGVLYEIADFSNFPSIARKCYPLVNEHIGEYVQNALSAFPNGITKCVTSDEMFEKAIEIIENHILYAAQHGGKWWTD